MSSKTIRGDKFTKGSYTFRIDRFYRDNLDIIKDQAIPNNWDGLGLFFGREGSGKSTLVFQTALYLDPAFNLSRVVFTPEQFENLIDNVPDGSAVVWDEAVTGASSTDHASKISSSIIKKLVQIRKKKLKILLCYSYLYSLNSYFIGRCLFSVYVYAKNFDDRGYAYFYSQPQTETLYWMMKDKYRYNRNMAISKAYKSFYFKFSKVFCLDEKLYDDKKEFARVSVVGITKDRDRLVKIICWLKETKKCTLIDISKVLGISAAGVTLLVKRENKHLNNSYINNTIEVKK